MNPYATKATPTAANANASGAARPTRDEAWTPVSDMASVGAITPTESEIVPRKPIWRRSPLTLGAAMPLEGTSVGPRLQGRRALVTGASRGIGRAAGERLPPRGARAGALRGGSD